ncbi:MAG: BON domain-containing protein [Dehalococcoidia bacterium]|nr:BON domain-containing protein [Dehalococcoidia bacterium]
MAQTSMYDVRPGLRVFDTNGEELGEVKEVRDRAFKVDASWSPDYWIEHQYVLSVIPGERVTVDGSFSSGNREYGQRNLRSYYPEYPEADRRESRYTGGMAFDREDAGRQRSGYGAGYDYGDSMEWDRGRSERRQFPGTRDKRPAFGSSMEQGDRGGEYRREEYRGDQSRGEQYGGEQYRGEQYRGTPYASGSDRYRARGYEDDPMERYRDRYRGSEGAYATSSSRRPFEWGYDREISSESPYRGSSYEPGTRFRGYQPGDDDRERWWDRRGSEASGRDYRASSGMYRPDSGMAGRGPKSYSRPDERICEDVCEALTRHPDIDASNVEVNVEGGEVRLHGTVETRFDKRLAEDVACEISGVRDVRNEIKTQTGMAFGHDQGQ